MTPRPEASRGVTIAGTGHYVPDRVLTNHDLTRMVETSDEWIRDRTGIEERRIAAPDQASSDLAVIAAREALAASGLGVNDVDQIIVATTTTDRILPSCACTVQSKLGARRAAAYDLFAACTGFIYGLGIGRGLVATGMAETVLVIGVETLSRITNYSDRNTCVLFGDGAGAVVLRPCATGEGLHSIVMQSDGDLGEILEVPAGGSLAPMTPERLARGENFIRMKGKELFKVAVRSMEESLRRALEQADLTPADIDLLIPHQANLRIIDAVRARLGFPAEKMLVNIQRYGNTSSASIPISLDEAVRGGRVRRGDRLGFVAFGGGVTWGAAVMTWAPPVQASSELAAPARAGAEA
ncbi:MAG: beta-ketoacyl-ACP synthase III [Candidatus Eisenbacteria bacterium]